MRLLPLDFGSAEREVASEQPAPSPDPEKVFEQEFVRALFERAVAAVRREYEGKERHAQFALSNGTTCSPKKASATRGWPKRRA